MTDIEVPFFRVALGEAEIEEVVSTLQSGWLTSGPKVQRFEQEFANAVGATHAVALNSGTAALHLAVEALGLKPNEAVLVPTLTFAATAEVVRYMGGIPILVDCDASTGNLDLNDAANKISLLRAGKLLNGLLRDTPLVGIIPVHVGGYMMDIEAIQKFAAEHQLWVVEDAAHAFPSSWRANSQAPWVKCGENTSAVACYSFYANKTITTGEGGMAVTNRPELAERMRLMSLHGLSQDAWGRFSRNGKWDYRIIAPGYKYNLTDVAAALGIHQLASSEVLRLKRESVANYYSEAFSDVEQIQLPARNVDRIHSWHLFPIQLRLDNLTIDRNAFLEELRSRGVGFSVHWRPLHLHPYYEDEFGWRVEQFPVATALWQRLISLPLFSDIRQDEIDQVIHVVRAVCSHYAK